MTVIIPATPAQPVVVIGGARQRAIEVDSTPVVWGDIGGAIANQADLAAALASGGVAWGGISGSLSAQTDLQAALNAKQATLISGTTLKTLNGTTLLGAGDIVISGVGGSGANLSYTAATRLLASDTGTDVTLPLATGTDAGLMASADFTKLASVATGATANATDASLRDRSTHTNTQLAATISDLATAVAATASVTANTAKVTNATHTGDVTGATALTIAANAVSLSKMAQLATSTILGRVTAATGNVEALTVAQVKTLLAYTAADVGASATGHTHVAADVTDFSTAADARIGAAVINALSDVIITTPSTGQALKYDGTNWTNQADATGGGGVSDGDKGDITVTATGATWTIDPGVVTLAKQADVATSTVFYRKTAAAGAPETQLLATLKTDLGLTGTNGGDQTITLTGDVTGTGTGSFAASIAADAVTFAKMQNISGASLLVGRGSLAGAGDPQEITLGAGLTMTAQVLSSTGAYTDEMAQDATGAMVDASLTYVDATPLLQRAALTGDVTAPAGSNATTIVANSVTNARLSDMATATFKGRVTAATGDPEDLTGTQATTLLDLATISVKGLAPVLSNVSTQYLSGTGVYSTPASGGVSDGDKGDITVSATGATWRVDPNIKIGLPLALSMGAFHL